jgi:broad specificity polyphosphatase/5'/3'-nucleotidase SurE
MIEHFVISRVPKPIRPLARALLGPVLAAIDTVVSTFRGDLLHITQEPQLVLSAVIVGVNAATVHTTAGYASAVVAALTRLFTSPAFSPAEHAAQGDEPASLPAKP